jgi:hypothetical protein
MLRERVPTPSPPLLRVPNRRHSYLKCALGWSDPGRRRRIYLCFRESQPRTGRLRNILRTLNFAPVARRR